MHFGKNDKIKYFKHIRKLRGQMPTKSPQVLHTPVGSFYGRDTLEGFASDAEFLAQKIEDNHSFDNEFYQLCVHDNVILFELKDSNGIEINRMTARDLDKILDKELKKVKAQNLYRLTLRC